MQGFLLFCTHTNEVMMIKFLTKLEIGQIYTINGVRLMVFHISQSNNSANTRRVIFINQSDMFRMVVWPDGVSYRLVPLTRNPRCYSTR